MKMLRIICALLALSIATTAVRAAAPATQPDALAPAGLSEVVRIWPGDPPATSPVDRDDTILPRGPASYAVRTGRLASMSVYLPRAATAPATAVIICPGGGYAFEQATGEGSQIAQALAARGIAAFVLRYRLPPRNGAAPAADELPMPQQDVLRAIEVVRQRAGHFNIDPKHVGVMGFSAGGHLAATAAVMYDDAKLIAAAGRNDAASKQSARPDFAVLAYPVITMKDAPRGSTRSLLIGRDPDAAVIARFSADQHVTPSTPPLFIVVAEDDPLVKPINSKLMADAAEKAGVLHELLTYPKGGHGFGLGAAGKTRGWLEKALAWLDKQGAIETR